MRHTSSEKESRYKSNRSRIRQVTDLIRQLVLLVKAFAPLIGAVAALAPLIGPLSPSKVPQAIPTYELEDTRKNEITTVPTRRSVRLAVLAYDLDQNQLLAEIVDPINGTTPWKGIANRKGDKFETDILFVAESGRYLFRLYPIVKDGARGDSLKECLFAAEDSSGSPRQTGKGNGEGQ